MTDDDIPTEPVKQVIVEHEGGEKRTLTGSEAQAWAAFIGNAMEFMEQHGGSTPDVEWEEYEG